MEALIHSVASVIDWRFAVGLVAGVVVTLRYVVVAVYHPIIREMQRNAGKDHDTP